MLCLLHEEHQGNEKCKKRARNIIWWPEISKRVEDFIKECKVCQRHQPKNQKEPLLPHELPKRAWEKVATDLLEFSGKT